MDFLELTRQEDKQWTPSSSTFQAYQPTDPEQFRGAGHSQCGTIGVRAVAKLTKNIVQTYQHCNASFCYSETLNPKRYLTNPSVPASNGGLDNENSDLILSVNGVLVNEDTYQRYIIKDLLGHGTFGQVVKCWGVDMNDFVAIKVIKNQPAYRQQAIVEISILNLLNGKYDPDDTHHIVRIFEHFIYKEHLCIVFEMLGLNLFELLRTNNLKGISLNLIRSFTKQILKALAVLRNASVIHCDLKPENINLTTRPASAEIKLIDFGSACREYRTVYSYIQSRFYRSPEVVLGHEYTTAIDMWSFGCVAAELYLGLPLFPAQSQYDLLQRMMKILGGRPPDHILKNAKNTAKYFKQTGAPSRYFENSAGHRSAYQFLTPEDYEKRESKKPLIGKHYFPEDWDLEKLIMKYCMKKGMNREEIEGELEKRAVFMDFIKGLVNFDPLKRWTPLQAAQHPFVTQKPFTGPFQPPQEAPRLPIHHQRMTVDHNPVSGHWLGAGLSPQVNPAAPQLGNPHYCGYHFSCGSPGSYGSHGEAGIGSFGDHFGAFVNYQPPSGLLNPAYGISPDSWHRVGHVPANQGLGHAHLGMSPSNNFMPMSLGASPSNFTPSSSYFLHSPGSSSTGSPSRYGPTSPARSSASSASSLGKVAALGQFHKRKALGSPASASHASSGARGGGFDSSNVASYGLQQSTHAGNLESGPSSYNEGSSAFSSPRSFFDHGIQSRAKNGMVLEQIHANKPPFYPTNSLGALIANSQSTHSGREDSSPPPNPGDWDPNYSEDLLLESDEVETLPGSALTYASSSGGPSGLQGLGVLIEENPSGNANAVSLANHGYRWNSRPTYQPPSRLGQQTTQFMQQQQQQQHQEQQLYQNSFNLQQMPHLVPFVQHGQIYFQGQLNGALTGTFFPSSSERNR